MTDVGRSINPSARANIEHRSLAVGPRPSGGGVWSSAGGARPSAIVAATVGTRPSTLAERPSAGVVRPSPNAVASTDNLGRSLALLSASEIFGPEFDYVRMSEREAVAATMASLTALQSRIIGSAHGFAPRLAFRDEIGRTNVRLARTYDGVPIFGCEVVTHLGSDGTVRDVTNGTVPTDLALDTKPRISERAAMATAAREFAAAPERTQGPNLVVVRLDDGEYRLAHYIALSAFTDGTPRRTHYFVDAHSGELLPLTFSDRTGVRHEHLARQVAKVRGQTIAATRADRDAPAEGTGNSIFSGSVPLTTTRDGDRYILRDPTNNDAETRDAHNGSGGTSSRNTVFTDNDNRWAGPGDDARVRDAVDAQYAAVQYLRYLREIFGRNSLDDRGKRLISNVHVYNNYANAFWDGETMNYGDGDGGENLSQTDSDTGGHEATHGLTDATSRLIYRGESGALNEAGSDVIGAAGFNWFLRGARGAGVLRDYLLFEDSYTPSNPDDAIRYMNDPVKDGASRDNYRTRYTGSADNGGVHWNSGIANNFFYLLAEGGANRTSQARVAQGIGMEKALRIYYRAHNVYFTPDTTFQAARIGWLKAATDLFGADSAEVRTVAQAADAVGIPGPPRPPTTVALLA